VSFSSSRISEFSGKHPLGAAYTCSFNNKRTLQVLPGVSFGEVEMLDQAVPNSGDVGRLGFHRDNQERTVAVQPAVRSKIHNPAGLFPLQLWWGRVFTI